MCDKTRTSQSRVANLLERPEVLSKTVAVDYRQTEQEALNARWYDGTLKYDKVECGEVIPAGPKRSQGVVEKGVFIIPLSVTPEAYYKGGCIPKRSLQELLDNHGLVSEDLHTAAAISERCSNDFFIQYQDHADNLCCIYFHHLYGSRRLMFDNALNCVDGSWSILASRK